MHDADELSKNKAKLIQAALTPCGAWYGRHVAKQTESAVGNFIGGPVADAENRNCEGHFRKLDSYRGVNQLGPDLSILPVDIESEEVAALSCLVLSAGPLCKGGATTPFGHTILP